MEIEHINDDTIRVKIDNSDLVERGITFLDLLGSQSQIESFFYSILEEVDVDEEFRDSEAVTFQVMPKNNGLELFISKGTQNKEDFLDNLDSETLETLQAEDSGSDTENNVNNEEKADIPAEKEVETEFPTSKHLVLTFNNIEEIILMAQEYKLEGYSTLYEYHDNYYLNLEFFIDYDSDQDPNKRNEIAHAYEFGQASKISKDVLDEYANKIADKNALELLKHYFK